MKCPLWEIKTTQKQMQIIFQATAIPTCTLVKISVLIPSLEERKLKREKTQIIGNNYRNG